MPFAGAAAKEIHDEFYWLDRLNRASLVMMSEQKILDNTQTTTIAKALNRLREMSREPNFKRTSKWSTTEPYLIDIAGPIATRLHTGRSTWDTGAVNERMRQREQILDVYESLIETRQALLDFGKKHATAIIPAYTGGVQAQPTSMGHFMTAYVEVFGRHAKTLENAYQNLNLSPFGAGALGTSSYPVDRQRLSDLLGFDKPIHNSYDAVLLASVENNMRLVCAVSGIAVTSGTLAEDLGNQYYLTKPWLRHPVNQTSGSTIMPQKQNPAGVNSIRASATAVLGHTSAYMFEVHNLESGRFAGGGGGSNGNQGDQNEAISKTNAMLKKITSTFQTSEFLPERALEQVLDDYATATELANALQRHGNIPFGNAHHIAAALVNFGRNNGLRATDISYADFEKIFSEAAKLYAIKQTQSGLTEDMFRKVMTPEAMVEAAQGLGGPQRASVTVMLEEGAKSISNSRAWLDKVRDKQRVANDLLDQAFSRLQ